MILNNIKLENFTNYDFIQYNLDKGINIFYWR